MTYVTETALRKGNLAAVRAAKRRGLCRVCYAWWCMIGAARRECCERRRCATCCIMNHHAGHAWFVLARLPPPLSYHHVIGVHVLRVQAQHAALAPLFDLAQLRYVFFFSFAR